MNNLWVREPFFHFIIIGALLFALYEWSGKGSYTEAGNDIQITATATNELRQQWLKQNGSEADKDTLDELVDSLVYQEVLLREAKRLGLDKNDIIVRRRLIQKMEFLSANLAQMQTPDEEALLAYYELNKEKYRVAEKRSFTHIYLSKEKRGERLIEDANALLAVLLEQGTRAGAPERGDNFILQYDYSDRNQQQLAQVFGAEFAQALFNAKTEQWQGPILSEYGAHLVYIEQASESYFPEFAKIRTRVLDDTMKQQLNYLKDKNYDEMRSRYQINVDYDQDRKR